MFSWFDHDEPPVKQGSIEPLPSPVGMEISQDPIMSMVYLDPRQNFYPYIMSIIYVYTYKAQYLE